MKRARPRAGLFLGRAHAWHRARVDLPGSFVRHPARREPTARSPLRPNAGCTRAARLRRCELARMSRLGRRNPYAADAATRHRRRRCAAGASSCASSPAASATRPISIGSATTSGRRTSVGPRPSAAHRLRALHPARTASRGGAALAVRIESRTTCCSRSRRWRCATPCERPRGHAPSHGAVRLPARARRPARERFDAWCDDGRALAAPADARADLAGASPSSGSSPSRRRHLFLKPLVTRVRRASTASRSITARARRGATYASLLEFGRQVRSDLRDLRPRDMIDVQSFIWVLGSDEYA